MFYLLFNIEKRNAYCIVEPPAQSRFDCEGIIIGQLIAAVFLQTELDAITVRSRIVLCSED
jgi:hypothetical protein